MFLINFAGIPPTTKIASLPKLRKTNSIRKVAPLRKDSFRIALTGLFLFFNHKHEFIPNFVSVPKTIKIGLIRLE